MAITIIKSIYGSCYYIIATVIAYLLFNVNCIFNIMFVLYPLLLLVLSHVAVLYNLLYALFSGSIVHTTTGSNKYASTCTRTYLAVHVCLLLFTTRSLYVPLAMCIHLC